MASSFAQSIAALPLASRLALADAVGQPPSGILDCSALTAGAAALRAHGAQLQAEPPGPWWVHANPCWAFLRFSGVLSIPTFLFSLAMAVRGQPPYVVWSNLEQAMAIWGFFFANGPLVVAAVVAVTGRPSAWWLRFLLSGLGPVWVVGLGLAYLRVSDRGTAPHSAWLFFELPDAPRPPTFREARAVVNHLLGRNPPARSAARTLDLLTLQRWANVFVEGVQAERERHSNRVRSGASGPDAALHGAPEEVVGMELGDARDELASDEVMSAKSERDLRGVRPTAQSDAVDPATQSFIGSLRAYMQAAVTKSAHAASGAALQSNGICERVAAISPSPR